MNLLLSQTLTKLELDPTQPQLVSSVIVTSIIVSSVAVTSVIVTNDIVTSVIVISVIVKSIIVTFVFQECYLAGAEYEHALNYRNYHTESIQR